MIFSSITFLFFFLPAVLLSYWMVGNKGRNTLLLLASLLFYAWGEGLYVLLMLASIVINYITGRAIDAFRSTMFCRAFFILAIILNLLIIGFFKYAHFFAAPLNLLLVALELPPINLTPIHLPIGISFFTFQAISYVFDVYRNNVTPQKSLINLGLYISLFPQLIAGPIVRYHDIAGALVKRTVHTNDFAIGIQRFLFGLSKKVLLANPLGFTADKIFALPFSDLSTPLAWLGAVCYSLQIYYDFSGYSDMAIGLGRMFGFRFLENFNYPYISKSIREFWRRWHISLSRWFRDYLYIPLGGNRGSTIRTKINLLIVFLLCGLWHGANWTFICWGGYHGFFLILERTSAGAIVQRLWPPFRHLLTLVIILIGWVLFRSETIGDALSYLSVMLTVHEPTRLQSFFLYVDKKTICELSAAILFSLPVIPALRDVLRRKFESGVGSQTVFYELFTGTCRLGVLSILTYFTTISLAAGVYNPFIYFRF